MGILYFALKNPKKFDKFYNILWDEELKSIFNWVIKYRIAYSFFGENAGEIIPPKITGENFTKLLTNFKSKTKITL